jgi:uncharacterized protein
MKTTLVLGASTNPERFSNRAISKLLAAGHPVIAVSPKGGTIEGLTCLHDLSEVTSPIDTVTLYVGPAIVDKELDKIIALKPKRVIFNPGTESSQAMQELADNAIEVVQHCTLVMLDSGRY